jgi:hypothetical protein
MIYLAAYTYYTFASSSHQANFGVVMRGVAASTALPHAPAAAASVYTQSFL